MNEETAIKWFGEQWYRTLRVIIESGKFAELGKFLAKERSVHTVYPSTENIFRAFRECPYEDLKVIILGQDVYHDGSAIGLAFANEEDTKISPSLHIILNEVERDIYQHKNTEPISPNLLHWAHQGVLLLNTSLTVRKKEPGSHIKQWKFFTDAIIEILNSTNNGLVFMLWGKYAQAYKHMIDETRHYILEAAHPATACYGKDKFTGCGHFSKTNEILWMNQGTKIEW